MGTKVHTNIDHPPSVWKGIAIKTQESKKRNE